MQRREFLIKSLQAGAAVAVPVVYSSCSKDDDEDLLPPGGTITIDLDSSQYSQLKIDGNAVVVQRVIVANTGDEEFVALSSVCTHQSCTISYNHGTGNFPCPCHGSVFSGTGSVLQGPATSPVKRFTVTREGNVLTVEG